MAEYYALFEPAEEGGYVVTFPDTWGATQGDTEAEAMDMATDALTLILTSHIAEGKPLPRARKYRGSKYRVVRLPALPSAKIALYEAFLASGIRKAELARRLGIPRANIDRLFDLRHHSRLDQIEAALAAMGKQLTIGISDAA